MVDADNGIGIDEFSEISRKLSGLLDESGLIDGKYSLEVSSPGIDQPLKSVRQYRKNVGRKLKIKSKGEILEGTLESVSENFVELALVIGTGKKKETSIVQIPFSEIEKAFVLVSFK
jgi:ribosome maturation factor RimP